MRKLILFLFLFLNWFANNHLAFGVSAYPYPVEINQPDGTKITVIQRGDEHVKWAQTVDGYSVMRNSRGVYEFAVLNIANDMIPSGVPAKNESDRNLKDIEFLSKTTKGLGYSKSQVGIMKSISNMYLKSALKAFPTSGARKLVCLLIGFSDKAFTKTKTDFENLFNQVGFVADGAMGSVYDFHKENSFGKLDLTVTVAGPFTAAQNMAFYGANNANGDDVNPGALVTEAIKLANPSVNYADFDNDNDGSVDGIYMIYAGYGEEVAGVSTNAIWAHSSGVPSLVLDGKSISAYACSAELRGGSGTGMTRIGVICHEFGHVMGSSDFYDTDNTVNGSYVGTGNWDVMAGGTWNNQGVTPAHHNPYTKIYVYDWATTTTLASGANITLYNAEQYANSFYRLNTATSNEFFLIENRQKQKFDSYIPGHGMVIYHVDENYISSAGNEINATSHQGMYPVCANATVLPPIGYGVINSSGLPFPGTGNKTAFTDSTVPNSLSWAAVSTNRPITNIIEDNINKTVSFTAPTLPSPPAASSANQATNILQTSFTANWNASATATGYKFDLSTNSGFTTFVSGYNDKDVGNVTSLKITGLNARTQYFYRIRAYNIGGTSDNTNIVAPTTLSNPSAAPAGLTTLSCNNLVTLKWRKNADTYAIRYRIYAGTTSNPTIQIDSTSSSRSDTVKVISGLIHGQNYFFRVTAVNDDGPESLFSSQSATIVKTGVVPVISIKWGDVLICSNLGDSIDHYQWFKSNNAILDGTRQYYATDKKPGAYMVETIDYEGCKNSSNIISALGTKSLTVSPNPAVVSFTLKLTDTSGGTALVSIINASGIKVMEFQAEYTGNELLKEIPVDRLMPGIYVVQVLLNHQDLYYTKIVVIK